MSKYSLAAFSLFPYFTKSNAGTKDEKRFQGLLYAIKNGEQVRDGEGNLQDAAAWFAGILHEEKHQFARYVGQARSLVPIPSSGVTADPPDAARWPMLDVAQRARGLAVVGSASPVLRRTRVLPKAHTVGRDEKPSVLDHMNSLVVDNEALAGISSVTLLDDVLTTGTSAMGCLLALRAAGFAGKVRLLTATHTVAKDYTGGPTASARSKVIWFDDRDWRRAWRPKDEVVFC